MILTERLLRCPPLLLCFVLLSGIAARAQTTATLTNPSACGLEIPLTDFNCPENVNFYNPDIFEIEVMNAPGTVLGTDVFLQEVRILVEHSWVSDMNFALRSPGGQTVELLGNTGGNGDNFGDTNLVACTGAMILRLGACSPIADGEAPFTAGPYRAIEDFYAFNDELTDPNATWELLICDDLDDDTGVLQFVELVFAPLSCLPVQNIILLAQDTTSATFTYTPETLCGTAVVEIGPPGFTPGTGATAGQGQVFTIGCPPFTLTGLDEAADYDIYVRSSCNGGTTFSDNSCGNSFRTGCDPAPVTALETFDDTDLCAPICNAECTLNSSWRNVPGDDMDWIAYTGSTPTLIGTGPDDDITGGGNYVYLEANGSQCPAGAEVWLQGPCLILDKQGTDSCHVSFSYHMSGNGSGSLGISASDDGGFTWNELWSVSGRQDTAWQRAYVSLADYPDGTPLQLRIAATKGTGIFGDIAVDHIRIHGSQVVGTPETFLYVDADEDGFGENGIPIVSCLTEAPEGYALNNLDCNDDNPDAFPGAPEIPCNGTDENCNAPETEDDTLLPPPATTGDTVCSGETPTISAAADPDFQVLWYETPDRSQGFVWVGNSFQPNLPVNTTAFPQVYTYYAEVTNFVCTTPVLGIATVTVLPEPLGEVVTAPETCPGQVFDLAAINIQDVRFTGATLSFHADSPADTDNELPTTLVDITEDTDYVYLLTSPDGCTYEGEVTLALSPSPEILFAPSDSFSLCRFQRDTILTTVTNGTAPYAYSWNTGRTTPDLPVMAADQAGTLEVYALTVTDDEGCFAVDSVLLQTTNSIDSLRFFTTPVSTCDGSDGTIAIVPLNGVPPFSYVWQDETGGSGSGTNVLDTIRLIGLPQNAYRVTITDSSADGCEVALRNLRIQGPGFQLAETSLQPPTCAGFDDGEICLDVTGAGTITYLWSDGQEMECASNLTAGSYSVTISNGDCTTVESYTLEEPDSVQIAVQPTAPTCADATDGRLQVTAFGGTPNYGYLWENDLVTPIRTNLGSGAYFLTVTDANGCVLTDTVVLDGPAPLTVVTDSLQQVTCTGAADGLIRVSGQGGTPPYRYLWEDGSTSPLRTNLLPNNYALTLTDFNDCETTTTITITDPAPLQVSLANQVQPLCRGDATGSLELLASGGTAPYEYQWLDGLTSTVPLLENLEVGTYGVIVEDANGCLSDTLEIELTPVSDLILTAVLTEPTCVGLEDGAIAVTAGGEAPHLYEWSTSANTPNLTGLPVGMYGLTVTDDRGCIADTVYTLAAEQVFTINSTVVQPSCFGVNDGIIDQTLIEQGQPPFLFFWEFDNTNHVDQFFLGPGEYFYSVTDAIGCTFVSDTFTITYPEPLTVEVVDSVGIACAGDENGFFETAASGGTEPYSYNWIGTGNTTSTIANLDAGDYRLSVTDARGCDVDTTLTLTDPPELIVTAELELGNVCDPDAVDVLTSTVIGGSGPYDYVWTDRTEGSSILNPEPGDYLLTVTDANGCESTFGTVKVQERVATLLLDSLVVQQVSCFESDDAQLTAYTSGGSDQLQYHFTPTYIEVSDSNAVSVSDITFGNFYSVTVTDLVTGCEVESGDVAGEQPDPITIVRDSFSVVNCFGGADGSIYVSVTGGTGDFEYQWTDEDGDVVSTMQDHRFATAGIYELLVTDENDCIAIYRDSNVVAINELIVISDTLITPVSCRGGEDGGLDIEIAGGVPPYSYEWSNDAMSEDLEDVMSGNYALTVTDSDTCRAIFIGLQIPQPTTELIPSGTSEDVTCFGDADGSIMTVVTGGDMPYTYRWRRDGVLIPSLEGPNLENLMAADYELEVTDTNGCVRSLLLPVGSPPELLADILNDPFGADSLTAMVNGGVSPFMYLWSNGDTTATITELLSGNYELLVTDSLGCTTTANYVLTGTTTGQVPSAPAFWVYPNPTDGTLWVKPSLTNLPGNHRLEIRNDLGQSVLTFPAKAENFGPYELNLQNLPAGRYSLWIIDEITGEFEVHWVIKL